MTKWEYLVLGFYTWGASMSGDVFVNGKAQRQWEGRGLDLLATLGEDGWEAVGLGSNDSGTWSTILLKRPKA